MHWLPCRNGRWISGIAVSPQATLTCRPRGCPNMLSEYIVSRSPLLQSPTPGQAATLPGLIRPIKALDALGDEIGTGSARN